MTAEFLSGMVAGAGWGLFVGAFLGAYWLTRLLGEQVEEDGGDAGEGGGTG